MMPKATSTQTSNTTALRRIVEFVRDRPLFLLLLICQMVATAALATLAIRSALRLETRWDALWYHLPFAAIRGGLVVPYELNDGAAKLYFQGFPPLPHFLQGVLWRLTGSINAAGVLGLGAFMAFLAFCRLGLRANAGIVALIALTAPIVLIHATATYVDLLGNSLLAIGVAAIIGGYLFPERSFKWVFIAGLAGFAGAAWCKFLMVPFVVVGLSLLFVIGLSRLKQLQFSRRRVAALVALAAIVASLPYLQNFVVYQNPFWPVRLPVLSDQFPFALAVDATAERPPPLKEYSQLRLFLHSLFEINHPTSYPHRARWIIDQGNAWIAFRMGGFWNVGVAFFLVSMTAVLIVAKGKAGAIVAGGFFGLLFMVALMPQSNELRYYQFIPLVWAAVIAMVFPDFMSRMPRVATSFLVTLLGLFAYMAYENRMHYKIERVDYLTAAKQWGAAQYWPMMEKGKTYCAVGMVPMAFLLTGPTMSEFKVVDRSSESLCPDDSYVLTPNAKPRPKRSLTAVTPADSSALRRRALALVNESLQVYQAGRYEEAIRLNKQAIALSPDLPAAYNNICAAFNALGNWAAGIEACTRALLLDPNFQLAKNNLAYGIQLKQRAEEAKIQTGK